MGELQEGVEDNKEEYNELYNGIWYYLDFPKKGQYEWIPENIMEDIFS